MRLPLGETGLPWQGNRTLLDLSNTPNAEPQFVTLYACPRNVNSQSAADQTLDVTLTVDGTSVALPQTTLKNSDGVKRVLDRFPVVGGALAAAPSADLVLWGFVELGFIHDIEVSVPEPLNGGAPPVAPFYAPDGFVRGAEQTLHQVGASFVDQVSLRVDADVGDIVEVRFYSGDTESAAIAVRGAVQLALLQRIPLAGPVSVRAALLEQGAPNASGTPIGTSAYPSVYGTAVRR